MGDFKAPSKCEIKISGMTCASCVSNIESNLTKIPGIERVSVALLTGKAVIQYQSTIISPPQIIDSILDMGFGAQLAGNDLSLLNSDNVDRQKICKLQLHIAGMTCSSCVNQIETLAKKMKGVQEASVALSTNKGLFTYDSDKVKPKTIMEGLEDAGWNVRLIEDSSSSISNNVNQNLLVASSKNKTYSSNNYRTGNDYSNDYHVRRKPDDMKNNDKLDDINLIETKKWRSSFLVAMMFGLPVIVVMMYGMIKNDSHHAPKNSESKHRPIVVLPGLSLENLILFLLCTPVQIYGAQYFYVQAYRAFAKGRHHLNMDTLVVLATTIAYAYSVIVTAVSMFSAASVSNNSVSGSSIRSSHQSSNKNQFPATFFDTPPMLIIFVTLGRWLECMVKGKTSQALTKLVSLQPLEAILMEFSKDQDTMEIRESVISVATVKRGDILKVLPGQKIPVDGKVVSILSPQTSPTLNKRDNKTKPNQFDNGTVKNYDYYSYVDESLITGESLPVYKSEGSIVIGGSINQNGVLYVEATHVGKDTALAQIVKLVEDAQMSKAPIQKFADKVASVFVPFVMTVSGLTLIAWTFVGLYPKSLNSQSSEHFQHSSSSFNVSHDSPKMIEKKLAFWDVLEQAFRYAITVLAISCPCSLGLATPTAVMVGTGVGAKNGLLFKGGGETMEKLGSSRVAVAVFDKTGTLTVGKPNVNKITKFVDDATLSLKDMLLYIGYAENNSEHPIATALTRFIKKTLNIGTFTDSLIECTNFMITPGCGLGCKIMLGSNNDTFTSTKTISELESIMLTSNEPDIIPMKELKADYKDGSPIKLPSDILTYKITRDKNKLTTENKDSNNNKQTHSNIAKSVIIGNREWMSRNGILVDPECDKIMRVHEENGDTVVLCAIDNTLVCTLSVSDTIKPEAHLAVYALKQAGLQVILLTGDNKVTAKAVAKKLGIRKVYAEVLPNHKARKIKRLQDGCVGKKSTRQKVMMIGDGINDSPALAQADIGIAISSGTDIAIEAADVVLIRDNLFDVYSALLLSKSVVARIRLNFFFASIYNLVAIPIAAGILEPFIHLSLAPWMGAAAMAFSSVSVVLSSLMLKFWRKPEPEPIAKSLDYQKNLYTTYLNALNDDSVSVHRGEGMDDIYSPKCTSKAYTKTLKGSALLMSYLNNLSPGRIITSIQSLVDSDPSTKITTDDPCCKVNLLESEIDEH
ncbi:unnamed protein product [Gordionus sp. m RMFG-2023]